MSDDKLRDLAVWRRALKVAIQRAAKDGGGHLGYVRSPPRFQSNDTIVGGVLTEVHRIVLGRVSNPEEREPVRTAAFRDDLRRSLRELEDCGVLVSTEDRTSQLDPVVQYHVRLDQEWQRALDAWCPEPDDDDS